MREGEIICRYLKSLPVGVGFFPSEQLLVDRYLSLKIRGMNSELKMNMPWNGPLEDIIREFDVCEWEPWELSAKLHHPVLSEFQTDEPEWFFFSPLHKKYSKGEQFKRETEAGFWKPTGKARDIKRHDTEDVIGTKRTLAFRKRHGPPADGTEWIIHEYRAAMPSLPNNKTYVLCRLQKKTVLQKKTGLKKKTGCGLSPKTNFNGRVPERPFIQATPAMNTEVDNSSTETGIFQNVPANIMTSGADLSHCANIIPSDIRNYEQDDKIPEEKVMLGRSLSSDLGTGSNGHLYEEKGSALRVLYSKAARNRMLH